MRATARLRVRALASSATMALVQASMPPMPRPVTSRITDRETTLNEKVAANIPVAMTTRQSRMVGRRPMRSARPPSSTDPTAMPISSIESTTPNAARSMPHSAAMPGEAKLIASTSKPSSAFSMMHSATAAICRRPMGASSSNCLMSVPFCAILTYPEMIVDLVIALVRRLPELSA